jgi:hypothetical protein
MAAPRAELETTEVSPGIWSATIEMDGYAIGSGHLESEVAAVARVACLAFEMWALGKDDIPELVVDKEG